MEQNKINQKSLKKNKSFILFRIYSFINFLIGFLFGLLSLTYGIMYLSDPHTQMVTGVITNISNCSFNVSSQLYECDFTVEYGDDKKTTNITNFKSFSNIEVNQEITLYVNPKNNDDVELYKVPSWLSIFLIVFGSILLLYSILPFLSIIFPNTYFME